MKVPKYFWGFPQIFLGACYKGKLPLFKIRVKLKIFFIPLACLKKKVWTLFSEFFSFLGPKISFPGRKT
jgi:hypothetical protein